MAVTLYPRRLASLSFALFSLAAGHIASRPRDDQLPHELLEFSSAFGVRQPSINGTPPLVSSHPPPELLRRDCLANGTNFCFSGAADTRYCSSCGICCSAAQSAWCCAADAVCCGSSCCGNGQTCSDGRCYLPRNTVTIPTTVLATVTQTETSIDTVVVAVFETSTVLATVDITITSSAATQTDWTYVTATAVEKRSLHAAPTASPEPSYGDQPVRVGLWEALRHTCDAVLVGWGFRDKQGSGRIQEPSGESVQAALHRRQEQEVRLPSPLQETTTIFPTVTQISTVASVIHNTITTQTTSIVTTTLTQTNTKIANAKTTVSSTSTITLTSRKPVTLTTTSVATAGQTSAPRPSNTPGIIPTPNQGPTGPPLPTATIVGIAVGSAVFAFLLAAAALWLLRWRAARAARLKQYEDMHLGLGGDAHTPTPTGYAHMRQPTLPHLHGSGVGTSAVPVATPPTTGRLSVPGTAAGRHTRSSSGFTGSTAVAAAAAAGGPDKYKRVSTALSSGHASELGSEGTRTPGAVPWGVARAEAPADHEVPARFEVDGAPARYEVDGAPARYEVDGSSPYDGARPGVGTGAPPADAAWPLQAAPAGRVSPQQYHVQQQQWHHQQQGGGTGYYRDF